MKPQLSAVHYLGGNGDEEIAADLPATTSELEVDRFIAALKIMKTFLRRNVRPLPRERSLVAVEDKP